MNIMGKKDDFTKFTSVSNNFHFIKSGWDFFFLSFPPGMNMDDSPAKE